MYKLLLVVLSSPNISLENFKTLLSEVAEVLPCILRQESDLLNSTVFQQISSVRIAHASEVNTEELQRRSYIQEYLHRIGQADSSFREEGAA